MQTPTPATDKTPFDDGALYDLLLGNLDLGLDFCVGLARAAGGPVLDVACGTGRILLPCLQAGVDVEGLDLFPDMLATLRKKASAMGFQPRLHQSDMASFRLDRRYALVMIPFNAFVHNLTTDSQIACLTCCREHLMPGGQLAFDTYFPGAALITQPDNSRVLEAEMKHPETGLPIRMFDTRSFDRVEQLQHSLVEVEFLDAAGAVTAVHRSQTTVRWVYKGEMALLLRAAGFARWQISGDFSGRPLTQETDAMIVQAWAPGEGFRS
jgi:SAM-dependent methyltransferase